MNFAVVGGILSQVARRIQDDYEGRHQVKTVSQIRDFIGKLTNLRAEHQFLRLRNYFLFFFYFFFYFIILFYYYIIINIFYLFIYIKYLYIIYYFNEHTNSNF